MPQEDLKQIHVYFSGSVQGVGFRYTAECSALKYGIKGWVKNCEGGKVEIAAQGKPRNIELFIEVLKKEFHVSSVNSCDESLEQFNGFEIRF